MEAYVPSPHVVIVGPWRPTNVTRPLPDPNDSDSSDDYSAKCSPKQWDNKSGAVSGTAAGSHDTNESKGVQALPVSRALVSE